MIKVYANIAQMQQIFINVLKKKKKKRKRKKKVDVSTMM